MLDWLKDNFINYKIKPTLIILINIDRNMLINNIEKESFTLTNNMENDLSIVQDCYNLLIDSVLSTFVNTYDSDDVMLLNDFLNTVYEDMLIDISNRCLLTSITIDNSSLFKSISTIHTILVNKINIRVKKLNILRVHSLYDINNYIDINPGTYIYNVDNDVIKIVSIEND